MADTPPAPVAPEAVEGEPDATPALKARVAEARQRAQETLEAARQRSRMVDAATTAALRPRVVSDAILASYLALRLFIMLVPLAYVAIAGFGLAGTRQDASDVSEDLGLSTSISSSIADAVSSSSRSHWLALVIGVGASAWAARGVLRAVRGLHAIIWRQPVRKESLTSPAPLVVIVVSGAAVVLALLFNHWRQTGTPWWLISLLGVMLWGCFWLLVSHRLPHAPCRWVHLLPGAVFFGVATQGMHVATTLYFGRKLASSADAYGALGVALVLLSWLVVVGWIIVLTAEANAGLYEWRVGAPERTSDPTDPGSLTEAADDGGPAAAPTGPHLG